MMNLLFVFFKDVASYFSVSVIVVFLFVFYYFIIPDYWFLCSILTIILGGGIRVFLLSKRG